MANDQDLAGLPEALEGAWAAIKDVDTWNALREYVERLAGDLNAERLRADTYVAKYEVAQERLQLLSASQNERADNALELWRRIETELAEYKQSADLRWKCDMRAIEAWRTAHPDSELTWPDHADLCVWLMTKIEEAPSAVTWEHRDDDEIPVTRITGFVAGHRDGHDVKFVVMKEGK